MSNEKMEILSSIIEEADPLFLIAGGSYVSEYDTACEIILKQLRKDLSIDQIELIIWDAFYREFCMCKVAVTKEDFFLDKNAAIAILGTPDRYQDISFNIRHSIIGL